MTNLTPITSLVVSPIFTVNGQKIEPVDVAFIITEGDSFTLQLERDNKLDASDYSAAKYTWEILPIGTLPINGHEFDAQTGSISFVAGSSISDVITINTILGTVDWSYWLDTPPIPLFCFNAK